METAEDVLNLLIENMQTQQENMDWLKNNVDKKIIEAVSDITPVGSLNKRSIITKQLDHERYVNAQKSVYKDIEAWAVAYLKKVKGE